MPPARLPPTPAASGEFIIKESSFQAIDAMSGHSFALPPAALSPVAPDSEITNTRKGSSISTAPISPTSPERKNSVSSAPRAGTKRTAAATAAALDEFNLPPPPTRSRKIIQMKPKTTPASSRSTSTPSTATATATKQSPQRKASTSKPSSGSTGTLKNGNNPTAPSVEAALNNEATSPTQPQSKRKQPSATSAAGRKIARKTAHSLIERRRRSKMNEEFATLKDMIPACRGQEMHKLAILQASIDYMNYLEECITELKNNASTAAGRTNSVSKKPKLDAGPPLAPPSPTSPEMLVPPTMASEDSGSASESSSSPEPFSQTNNSSSSNNNNRVNTGTYYSSPSFSPYTGPVSNSQQIQSLDGINHPILPSPALGPLYSPQMRAQQQQSEIQPQLAIADTTSYRVPRPIASATPSPAILPQQHHQHQQQHRQSISSNHTMASPVFVAHDSIIDQEASAALLMLNMDRRGASISEGGAAGGGKEDKKSPSSASASASQDRRMGISVRDLLTS